MPTQSCDTVQVPALSHTQDNPMGPACPPHLQHIPAAAQLFVSTPNTTVNVAVQTIDQSEPNPDPPSPVPSLSWLLEDDASDEVCTSEHQMVSVTHESNIVE